MQCHHGSTGTQLDSVAVEVITLARRRSFAQVCKRNAALLETRMKMREEDAWTILRPRLSVRFA
jgi:hypothetical protein